MSCADGTCGCCCASITGLRGGIHPDHIKSVWRDLTVKTDTVQTFKSIDLILEPIHIVSASVSLMSVARDTVLSRDTDYANQLQVPSTALVNRQRKNTPVSLSLFTTPGWNYNEATGGPVHGGWNAHDTIEDGRVHITTCSLTSHSPTWTSPPDLFGYFCDGGLFMEMNAPLEEFGLRVVVNYVDRAAFSPAYKDPIDTLQHYWSCHHPDKEFLEGFYLGSSFENDGDSTAGSGTDTGTATGSEGDGNPFTSESWPGTF